MNFQLTISQYHVCVCRLVYVAWKNENNCISAWDMMVRHTHTHTHTSKMYCVCSFIATEYRSKAKCPPEGHQKPLQQTPRPGETTQTYILHIIGIMVARVLLCVSHAGECF